MKRNVKLNQFEDLLKTKKCVVICYALSFPFYSLCEM